MSSACPAAWRRGGIRQGVGCGQRGNGKRSLEQVVDRLLASPQFGERWGRHWLDLIRFAESRGTSSITRFRMRITIAITSSARSMPTCRTTNFLQNTSPAICSSAAATSRRFNESILGTAFWFLGEEVHSPVDIRQDEADRFDNRLDVIDEDVPGPDGGVRPLPRSQVRRHLDEGLLRPVRHPGSSNYRLARFDTITHNRQDR